MLPNHFAGSVWHRATGVTFFLGGGSQKQTNLSTLTGYKDNYNFIFYCLRSKDNST